MRTGSSTNFCWTIVRTSGLWTESDEDSLPRLSFNFIDLFSIHDLDSLTCGPS